MLRRTIDGIHRKDFRERTGFDLDACKGCAICAEICPVGAIAMVAE